SASGARAPVNGNAKRVAAPPAAREPRPAKREPRPGTAAARPARDVPSRNERTEPREPITERLPVRARQQPPAPAARRDTDRPGAGSYAPEPRSVRDTGPHAQRDPLRDGAPRARRDTGPHQHPEQPRRSATGPNPVRDRERDLAMLAGLVSAPPPIPGALEDDPLTSPSFSLKADTATDSRSYGNGRKHAKTTGQGATPAHRNGNGNGGYPPPDYASPDHAYQATPPAPRPSAAPAPAEQWYNAPAEAPPPAYRNPPRPPPPARRPGPPAPPGGQPAPRAPRGPPGDPAARLPPTPRRAAGGAPGARQSGLPGATASRGGALPRRLLPAALPGSARLPGRVCRRRVLRWVRKRLRRRPLRNPRVPAPPLPPPAKRHDTRLHT